MNKTILLIALVSAASFAQEAPPPPPPAPPPAVAAPADAPTTDPGGRVRWGVSANIGWHIPSMFTIGGEGRIGYVFSNLFNAYLIAGGTGGFGFGGSVTNTGGSVSVSGVSYWFVGAIAELMFANIFYVGGGPVLTSGGYGVVGLSANADPNAAGGSVSAMAHSGFAPGLDLRLGLGLGGQKANFRRGGFNIGLNVLTVFRPGTVVTRVTADQNGGSITANTNELVVTAAPMLMLGYDAR